MPRSSRKKTTNSRKEKAAPKSEALPLPPQDLPDPESVIAEVPFTSPKGNTYRIIITDEVDAYEEPERPPEKQVK
ncbi:MAG TPA: hypothetical protein VEW94_13345 [Chloroflexia bacterium]|nr:hypothetical protein [Chloroflexia bacterium]